MSSSALEITRVENARCQDSASPALTPFRCVRCRIYTAQMYRLSGDFEVNNFGAGLGVD